MPPNLMTDMLLNRVYPIVIAQYQRDDFGVGGEHMLHWALVVLWNKEDPFEGHAYQAIDRHYSDGRGVIWKQHDIDIVLNNTVKCLGAIQIGEVKARKFKDLHGLIVGYPTVPKAHVPGWNCRDWVLEVVELLREKGCIYESVYPAPVAAMGTKAAQPHLLQYLRTVSVQTAVNRRYDRLAAPAVYWV
ncbi:hypothetical protein Hypma_012968 [Hypsizygus marmoreus]|uniref:Uncharacterized protein n=1 Tax=Hypsizygus marmoreus TaxID=39966 RepID=A0A369JCS2_HYPMA|nr:hypothetical protein Hypma_012968 [Hypsizygus marmoreus]